MAREFRVTFNSNREVTEVEVKSGNDWIEAEKGDRVEMPAQNSDSDLSILIGGGVAARTIGCTCPQKSGKCWICMSGECYYYEC